MMGQGEGDYCIYEIASPGADVPRGTLLPIPETPRFESTVEATKWIRTKSGDLLAGKQVMIFRAMEIMTIRVAARPIVEIESKPKILVDPKSGKADD